ncbi:MAG: type II toxin-antitoxin system RelE/ParE family toxin [Pararhizobium sp.]
MRTAKVVLRERAERDIDDVLAYYLKEAGDGVALSFVDHLQAAYRRLAAYPAAGSLRYAYELGFAGLRFVPLKRFPFLVFYIENADQIDVLRVLHAERDIPPTLRD